MKQKFNVEGMHCTMCSSRLDKTINQLEGVYIAHVNLLQNTMLVDYDEQMITNEDICSAVKKIGFNASMVVKQTSVQAKKESHTTLWISVILLTILMYLHMGHMFNISMPDFLYTNEGILFNLIAQCLITTVILVLHAKYFVNGVKAILAKEANMDSLVAIGSGASYLYSVYLLFPLFMNANNHEYLMQHMHQFYFESAAMIVVIITIGKHLEHKSKAKTSQALHKLMDLTPKNVIVVRDEKEIEIEFDDIMLNDILLIKTGQVIGVDGVIIRGHASIDESSISGESIPLDKQEGDEVIGGTLNVQGTFYMKALKIKDETTLAQIIQMVENASSAKPKLAKLADSISKLFVPIVVTLASIVFIVWYSLGYGFEFAFQMAISVLVISCPCALGLATPTAIMVASGNAATQGILLKRSESLERIHAVTYIVLDKTGTITYGKPEVTTMYSNNHSHVLEIAQAIEAFSEHPISKAIMQKAKAENITSENATNFITLQGLGASASYKDVPYFLGNMKLMEQQGLPNYMEEEAKQHALLGETLIYLANEHEIIAMFSLSDKIKPSSIQAISQLKELGYHIAMLSGDHLVNATMIAKQTGIEEVYAQQLPQDKAALIKKLQANNHKVMMVGDGINDAIALSQADVAVAIGAGSDIAIESADIVLVKSDLSDIVKTIHLGKRVIRNIKQNLFWAFIYNVIGIPIAAGLFFIPFGLQLNPIYAAAAMSLSSICVVLNALRLSIKK